MQQHPPYTLIILLDVILHESWLNLHTKQVLQAVTMVFGLHGPILVFERCNKMQVSWFEMKKVRWPLFLDMDFFFTHSSQICVFFHVKEIGTVQDLRHCMMQYRVPKATIKSQGSITRNSAIILESHVQIGTLVTASLASRRLKWTCCNGTQKLTTRLQPLIPTVVIK